MIKSFLYDAFISYSHNDSQWVKKILIPKLESHNFKVIIDYRDFRGGSFSIEEMERAVIQSRNVILVLTEDYLKSNWSKFENIMAQSLDPSAIQRKIIPILRKSCKIPLRLKILHYRDMRTNDIDQWELLIQDLI